MLRVLAALPVLLASAIDVPHCLSGNVATRLSAQGLTTGAIAGTLRTPGGEDADGARVRIVNLATGYTVESAPRTGRFRVAGLEVGGPYVVQVRLLGFAPYEQRGIQVLLGQDVTLDVILTPAAAALEPVRVIASPGLLQPVGAGTGTAISDSLLRRMPTLNRDMLDVARVVPQAGTRYNGLSAAGTGYRYNSYLIDGVSERMLNGNSALTGVSAGKPISIDAVKEYQVLLAPYEARHGDFTGALVNAVTRNGTNDFEGTAFIYARNERLARRTPFLRESPYDRAQFGFAAGGPIVRDRAHFFVSTELQRFRQPATGPYIARDGSSATPAPVSNADVERYIDLLKGYGLEPGDGGQFTRSNPNTNIFARIDFALPRWRTRAALRHNHAGVLTDFFSRPAAARFPMTSNSWTQDLARSSTALQVFTQLRYGALNELVISRTSTPGRAANFARSPLIETTVPGVSGGRVVLVAGSPDVGQGTGSDQRTTELSDHVTLPVGGAHVLTAGARAEMFAFNNISTRGQFGRWTFSSLDSLERGEAATFRVERDFGSATDTLRGVQLGIYIGDAWKASDHLSLTFGLRADAVIASSNPADNPVVFETFERRTRAFIDSRFHLGPRIGFTWDDRAVRVRGGAGVFSVRTPLAWLHQSLRFDGMGTRTLSCAGRSAMPAFSPDPRTLPSTCADGTGYGDGPVNMVDPASGMTKLFKASLAHDRLLPWGASSTIEVLYTRTLADLIFENLNLAGPQGVDRHGRVLYGAIDDSGRATPALRSSRFPEVIGLRRHDRGWSYSATASVRQRLDDRLEASVSYTHSRVRDVASILTASPVQTVNAWGSGRTMSGRHDQLPTGTSAYEIPHRVVLVGTWSAPWRRLPTDVSVQYTGESGFPFTYTDSSAGGRGDLNADGTNSNDPVYVPRSAADAAEITFAGTAAEVSAQQAALEDFIERSDCLRRQRGRIMERNSCRGPWIHTTSLALRQSVPAWRSQALTLELQVFNFLNLLNEDWGHHNVPNAVLLEHVRQTPGPESESQPVFRFNPGRSAFSTQNIESSYQIQLALRYTF